MRDLFVLSAAPSVYILEKQKHEGPPLTPALKLNMVLSRLYKNVQIGLNKFFLRIF